MLTSAVGAIQRLPVQGNLLDKDITPIEDANLPSNRGTFITEVKGHYLNFKLTVKRSIQPRPLEMSAALMTVGSTSASLPCR